MFKRFIIFIKYIIFNKKKLIHHNNNENIVLVELYNIKATILSFSIFSNAFANLYKCKIIAYVPRFLNKKQKIKFYILNFFSFVNFFGLYKSFGVKNFIIPRENNISEKEFNKIKKYILSKITQKKDILKIKIKNIKIGDILYDTYLREKNKITIDINSLEFHSFIEESIKLFLFWYYFLLNKKIKGVVISHSVYLTALPARIAIYLNKKAYAVAYHSVFQLTKKNLLVWGGFEKYPKQFNKFSIIKKIKSLKLAKRELSLRFEGKKDNLYKISNEILSRTFDKNIRISKPVLNSSNKTKILVAAHDFTDAIHGHGDMIFPDMYEWINFLMTYSQNKSYEWYIKLHPADYDLNLEKMKNVIKNNINFIILPKNISHTQLIKEGIDCAITVFGSIGHEYPYFGIPVINAGANQHMGYNFNYHPKTKNDYLKLLDNIENLKTPKNVKTKIYEFYFMKYMQDYNILPGVVSVNDLNSSTVFLDFLNNYKYDGVFNNYKKFIKSNKRRLIVSQLND